MSNYIIYKYTSPSGKSYIGQTNDPKRRKNSHKHPTNSCINFRNAINKYGWDNILYETLAENLSLEEANLLEERLIIDHNTLAPNGYNLRLGGNNHTHSEESKQRMSVSQRKRIIPPHTEEHKQNISNALKGRPSPTKGKKFPGKGKGKTSSLKGRIIGPQSEETKLKKSLVKIGKPSPVKGRRWRANIITGKREYYFP